MVFADFLTELFGYGCVTFVLILMGIGWVISKIGEAAGSALKNEEIREGIKIGFWAWFFSDDD